MEENKTDFNEVVKKIKKNEILLPDFQRKFVWTDETKQKKIVASVLAKMPIGSILLLKSQSEEFSCKAIGRKKEIKLECKKDIQYLLDGQQRITVLSMVFSNVIYENIDSFNELLTQSLKRRFFLKLPNRKNSAEQKDIFGVWNLQFPYNNPEFEEPDFLISDILEYITIKTFKENDSMPYNPKHKLNLDNALENECIGNEKYLIPLFLMVKSEPVQNISETVFSKIIRKISEDIQYNIEKEYEDCVGEDTKREFAKKILTPEMMEVYENKKEKNEDNFCEVLAEQGNIWIDKFKEYLRSCIRFMSLNQITVEESMRDRAIDIYENLNLGGISLNTFDLVMAKAAKAYKGNFYERIITYMSKMREYPKEVLPDGMESKVENVMIEGKYSCTEFMNAYDAKKNEIKKLYLDVFLNVISLACKNENNFSVDLIKKNRILKMQPEDIVTNCEKVCNSIDRGLFFLQSRCGIRDIKDINYNLILVIVSYIFMDEDNFKTRKVHDLLEAWYWCSIFSGEFDRDQNQTMIRNLEKLLKTLNNDNDIQWIMEMKERILEAVNFSDKNFLLLKNAQVTEKYPKDILKSVICQFFVSRTYQDIVNEDITINAFMDKEIELQMHHVIPLGSVKKIGESAKKLRQCKWNILNSPLNYVLITKSSNLNIDSKTVVEYQTWLKPSVMERLCYGAHTKNCDNVEEVLSNRFDTLKGKIIGRVEEIMWNT